MLTVWRTCAIYGIPCPSLRLVQERPATELQDRLVQFGTRKRTGKVLRSCKSWAGVVQRPLLDSHRPETLALHGEEVYPVTGYHPRTAERD
jgi:hypothetical protein